MLFVFLLVSVQTFIVARPILPFGEKGAIKNAITITNQSISQSVSHRVGKLVTFIVGRSVSQSARQLVSRVGQSLGRSVRVPVSLLVMTTEFVLASNQP